jgi:hypothetical protein
MLDDQHVRQLLAVVMAYDNRKPGDATVLAWSEAARRGRWTYAEAVDAVHAHYATSTEWLMPGHITARVKASRPVHTMSEGGPEPDQLGQARVAAALDGAFLDVDEHEPAPARALPPPPPDVACPHCSAAPGEPCTRPGRRAGERTATRPHPSRIAS